MIVRVGGFLVGEWEVVMEGSLGLTGHGITWAQIKDSSGMTLTSMLQPCILFVTSCKSLIHAQVIHEGLMPPAGF